MTSAQRVWGLLSSLLYLAGGIQFIIGSAYTIPNFMDNCHAPGCGYEIAIWYFSGCMAYFLAAVIDLVLQISSWLKDYRNSHRVGCLRFDSETESLISAFVYLVGSILFFFGALLFFPGFNMVPTARLVFRAGSFTYIFGSTYGIMQLLTPWCRAKPYRLRRNNMVEVQELDPSEFEDPEAHNHSPEVSRKSSFASIVENDADGVSCKTIAVGLFVKLMFISGSTCFLIGGFLFQEHLFFAGGYLWFFGSFLFTAGSATSLTSLLKIQFCESRQMEKISSVVAPEDAKPMRKPMDEDISSDESITDASSV